MAVIEYTVAPSGSGPQRPIVTKKDIWAQFKIDITGKEVQTAETYSHSWVANQFGHVCLGIVLGSALGVVLGRPSLIGLPSSWGLPFPRDNVVGAISVAIGVALWEWRAYRHEVKGATGPFLLDRKLLRNNALVATAYMVLGVATAFVYRHFALTDGEWLGRSTLFWGTLCVIGFVLIGIGLAVPWLRQKITWQKAALPYLFRLADAQYDDPQKLQDLINSSPPSDGAPRQIVIGGPIGSGRTELCAGIGTEFAFRNVAVRYLTLTTLLEFAAKSQQNHFADDSGPKNIAYWPWSGAQVVIIDDIGPLLTAKTQQHTNPLEQLRHVLNSELSRISAVLAKCHTVWAIGDPRGGGEIATDDEDLERFAHEIGDFCNSRERVLVVQLDHRMPEQAPRARTRYL